MCWSIKKVDEKRFLCRRVIILAYIRKQRKHKPKRFSVGTSSGVEMQTITAAHTAHGCDVWINMKRTLSFFVLSLRLILITVMTFITTHIDRARNIKLCI